MLLTSPVTLNDGTGDHIYTYQNQIQVGQSIVSTWKELAADPSLQSTFKTKYNSSHPTLYRNVAQVNKMLPLVDSSLRLATFNISCVCDKQHTVAALTLLGLTLKDALVEANFWSNFINQI
jgi:hypothetical protein